MFIDYGMQDGNVKIYYDLEITSPDNSVYLSNTNIKALDMNISQKNILMAEEQLKICFEPEDMYGIYQINITIHDEIGQLNYTLSANIELLENIEGGEFNNDEEYSEWMMNYYKNPRPQDAIDAYQYYIQSEMSQNDNSFPPMLGFYKEIFQDNLYLLDRVIKEYDNYNLRSKIFFTHLLYYLNHEKSNTFLESLTGKGLWVYNELQQCDREYITDPIVNPMQLDYLWGSFFAAGKYEHIITLVNALSLVNSNPIIHGATRWSISSNCNQHELIRNYCEYIYAYESLSQTARDELGSILDK